MTAVVVTALFLVSGGCAIKRWARCRSVASGAADYALHTLMSISMILMTWFTLPTILGTLLIVTFGGGTLWFATQAVNRADAFARTRFRMLATYHSFMMATTTFMVGMTLAVDPTADHGHPDAMPGMVMSDGGHGSAGAPAGLDETTTALGIGLGIVAVFWSFRAIHGIRHDGQPRRRRAAELRVYELAMALGMAVMLLSHNSGP